MSAYRFYLYHPDLQKPQRIKDPVGWDSSMKTIERDPNWHGVFFKYTPKLQFIKDGKAIIQGLYEQYGIEAEIELFIYKRASNRKFEIDYRGRLSLIPGSLVISKLFLTCNIDQTGFTQKLKNRQDVKVNLQSLLTQDGSDITPYTNETHDVTMHSKVIRKIFSSEQRQSISYKPSEIVDSKFLQFDLDFNTSEEIEEKFNIGNAVNTSIPVNLFTMLEAGEYEFDLRFEFSRYRIANPDPDLVCLPETSYLPTGGNLELYIQVNGDTPQIFSQTGYNAFGKQSTAYTYTGSFTLSKGDTITIYGDITSSLTSTTSIHDSLIMWGVSSTTSFENPTIASDLPITTCFISDVYTTITLNIGEPPSGLSSPTTMYVQAASIYPETTVPFVLMHEAFDRVVHSITDEADSFRSTVYGRTDSEPVTYDEDGGYSLKGISRALSVRGFPIATYPIYASLKDLLKTAQAIDGVGIGIEKQDTKERVVVQDLTYFYQPEVGWQLNNVTGLEKVVLDDYFFNELEIGYEKWSNEQINNLDEFNTKREFVLPITQVKKKLSLLSPYIGSGYTFEFLRRDAYTVSSTKDNDRDNDNVIVQMLRDGADFVPQKDEGFDDVNNLISPETSYNLELSPMRNLLRNGRLLRGGLLKQTDKNVTLAFGEGNTEMTSEKTGESLLSEKQLAISNLPSALWTGEAYKFKAKVTTAKFAEIESNLYKYGEFSETSSKYKKGYLLKMEPDKDGYTSFLLLRANA